MNYLSTPYLMSCRFALAPLTVGVLLASFSASATNVISLENLKPGSARWQHHDVLSALYTEKEARGKIKRILPEVHDISTYCSPTAANFPWAQDDCVAAYTDKPSANIGSSIRFKVTVNPAPQTYSIEIFRLGWYNGAGATLVQSIPAMPGVKQPECPMAPNTGETECNWSTTYTLNIPTDWVTGVYTAILTNEQGWKTEVLFVVRDDNKPADFLYPVPVLTYAAYNNYPNWSNTTSKSLYDASSTGANTVVGTPRAVKSSLERPQHHQFGGWLGSDWTEIHLVAWLEKMGYHVNYTTDVDLDAMQPSYLQNYKGILFGGHSEYWTRRMYENVESARDAGVNLAFFGANAAHWQVRLEYSSKGKPARSMACYKDTLTSNFDPVYYNSLKTKKWRDLGKPEQTLVGVQYPIAGWYLPNVGQPPLIVKNTNHWVYNDSNLTDGSQIPHLVGYEVDNLDPNYPAPKLFNPASQTILAESPFVTSAGPEILQQSSIYQAPSGAWVFGAGTMSWSWGLGRLANANESFEDAGIQKTTKNILDKFLKSDAANPTDAVTVYADANYGGVSQKFGVGRYRAISGQLDIIGNDTLSSIKVPAGYGVKICQHEPEFGYGYCQKYTSSVSYVGWFMNDQTSYIEVFNLNSTEAPTYIPVASAFENYDFNGKAQYFGLGEYRSSAGQLNEVGNDAISSLFVPQGYALKACEHEPEYGYGQCATFTGPVSYLGYLLNNKISYLKFYKL